MHYQQLKLYIGLVTVYKYETTNPRLRLGEVGSGDNLWLAYTPGGLETTSCDTFAMP